MPDLTEHQREMLKDASSTQGSEIYYLFGYLRRAATDATETGDVSNLRRRLADVNAVRTALGFSN